SASNATIMAADQFRRYGLPANMNARKEYPGMEVK
ncbi:MAG: hypothetical protein JWO78_1924, partial [Micavibrio sp.]|nr:hypothetical protein [Micavibrio sp.]